MKRVLKIFGICLGAVIVGMGLLVGGAWVFGAFSEKKVPPKDIAFAKEEIVTSSAAALRVTTATEGVNQKAIDITVSPSGILDAPKVVTLDEDFIVWPIKGDDGYNVGGIVNVTASYNGLLVAKCRVKVDVPVDDIVVKTQHTNLSKGEQITFNTEITPARALNPWKTDIIPGDINLYDEREKTIYYVLYDDSGYLMDTTKAYFYDSGRRLNMLKSSDIDSQTRIVAVDECEFLVKAFCFSTFAREDHYNIQNISDLKYQDGREQIKEEYLQVLKEAHAESGSDEGQFVTVTDVYINSFTATEEEINVFVYETSYLTARTAHTGEHETNLDIKLHPAETSAGYTYEHLDGFIDNIVLEWESGAELKILKQGTFEEGSPSDWKWTICPTVYDDTQTTAKIKATINYYDNKTQQMQVLDWHFNVKINIRPISGIIANKFIDAEGKESSSIFLNSDSPDTNSIRLEEGFASSLTTTGLLTHSYEYFDIIPQTGYSYTTFSLIKFFLPENSVVRPEKKGTYKVSFEFEEKNRSSGYRINFTDGNPQGDIAFYKLNEQTGQYEVIEGSPAGENGKYRAEIFYDKKTEGASSFDFYGDGSEPIKVNNVLYYEEGSEYPYCVVNGVKLKTFFNSDTMLITRQLAEITAEGYGTFYITATVVVSDNNGAIIYDQDGKIKKTTATKDIQVDVINSVKDIKLSVTAKDGSETGVHQADFAQTVLLDENAEYYIYIAPGDNTSLDVLSQAVAQGLFEITYKVRSDYERKDASGNVINSDSLIINEIEEDRDENDVLKGYKFVLEVKNVFGIKNKDSGDPENILFSIKFNVAGTKFEQTKVIQIRDHAINDVSITYGDSAADLRIYATDVTEGEVLWTNQNNQRIDLSEFNFTYSSDYSEIEVEKNILFTTESDVVLTGLIYATADENGKYKLTIDNFPYNKDGILVQIKLSCTELSDEYYKRYVYNKTYDYYELEEYATTEDTFNITIYGFKINYEVKPASSNIVGTKDETVDFLAADYATVTMYAGNGVMITKPIFKDIVDFAITVSDYFSLNGSVITILKSITDVQTVTITMYIGKNTLITHNLIFKSPYAISVEGSLLVQDGQLPIKAPKANIDLKQHFNVTKAGQAVDSNLIKYSFADSELSNGKKVSDYVTISEDGIMDVKYVPFDFEVNVNITIYEKLNDELGYEISNLESKGTWTGFEIEVTNDFKSNNNVNINANNVMYGDMENHYIDISSIYSGNDYTMEISFEGHNLVEGDESSPVFVRANKKDNYGYSIYASDIVSDTPRTVKVMLSIAIPDRGDTYAEFYVYVHQYMYINFARNITLTSGSSIGASLSSVDNYTFKDIFANDIVLVEGGISVLFSQYEVAEESLDLIEIQETTDDTVVKAKANIQAEESLTAYIIITRKVYYGGSNYYEVQHKLALTVVPSNS